MVAKDSLHVVPHTNGWAVSNENTMRALKTFTTKAAARKFAWDAASQRDGYVVLHKTDGTIQQVVKPERRGYDSDQHVVPHEKGWAVLKENGKRATAVFKTKTGAVSRAKEIAKNQDMDVVIHDSKGLIKYTGGPRAFLEVQHGMFG